MLDLGLLALSAGIYSVPMYALIQMRSQPTHRARIIAANNILNALFMIASAVLAGALLAAGCSIPQVFLITGIANAIVALYVFLLVPEYLLRFVAWVITHFVYRFKVRGDEHIPRDGAAVLVCNHVSFVDAILLMAASPRPIHFVMDHRIFQTPVLGWLFKLAKAIPIAPHKEDPATYEAAFARAAEVLREGDLLAIFPEGGITFDGQLQPFKGGIMKILDHARDDGLQVPVIPMALTNLWGSYFSRIELRGGRNVAMVKPLRRGLFNRVGLEVGEPVAAACHAGPAAAERGGFAPALRRKIRAEPDITHVGQSFAMGVVRVRRDGDADDGGHGLGLVAKGVQIVGRQIALFRHPLAFVRAAALQHDIAHAMRERVVHDRACGLLVVPDIAQRLGRNILSGADFAQAQLGPFTKAQLRFVKVE
jgi:1-acyl-sn-glycerol-3-phosphate acyltransferase